MPAAKQQRSERPRVKKFARLPGKKPYSYLEYEEFVFRTRKQKNGYWVTIAAIWIPEKKVAVFGASACSPEDEYLFVNNRRSIGADRALQRARDFAFRVFIGQCSAPKRTLINQPVFNFNDIANLDIGVVADIIYPEVALNAEYRAAEKAVTKLQKQYKHFDIRMRGRSEGSIIKLK